jgi:hypothetical protein
MVFRQLLQRRFATGFWMGFVVLWLLFLLAVVVFLGSLLLVAGGSAVFVTTRRYRGRIQGFKAWHFRAAAVLEEWRI